MTEAQLTGFKGSRQGDNFLINLIDSPGGLVVWWIHQVVWECGGVFWCWRPSSSMSI